MMSSPELTQLEFRLFNLHRPTDFRIARRHRLPAGMVQAPSQASCVPKYQLGSDVNTFYSIGGGVLRLVKELPAPFVDNFQRRLLPILLYPVNSTVLVGLTYTQLQRSSRIRLRVFSQSHKGLAVVPFGERCL